jgi:carbonic anhydrase
MTTRFASPTGAQEALALLKDGNNRFVRGLRSIESLIRSRDLELLAEKGQKPFCIILTCSDSRIPTEILFDRGPGDIFVVRVAGNIVTPALIGSIEFAAESFDAPLCVVMGHAQCGAVKAALSTPSPEMSPNLREIVDEIRPAALQAIECSEGPHDSEECIARAVELNISRSVWALSERSPILRGRLEAGKLAIVGAHCDLRTGKVDFEPIGSDAGLWDAASGRGPTRFGKKEGGNARAQA